MKKIKKILLLLVIFAIISLHYLFADFVSLNQYLSFLRPTYLYALTSLPIALVLPFVNESTFKTWLKFAVPWLIFSILVITFMPQYASLLQPGKNDVARWMGILFSVISLIVLAVIFVRAKLKTRQ